MTQPINMFQGWRIGTRFKTETGPIVTILNIQVYENTEKPGEKIRFLLCVDEHLNQITYDMEGNPISAVARTLGPLMTNVSLGLANQLNYPIVDPMDTIHPILPGFAKEETDLEIMDMDKAMLDNLDTTVAKFMDTVKEDDEDNEIKEELEIEDLPEEPDDDERDDLPVIDNDEPL